MSTTWLYKYNYENGTLLVVANKQQLSFKKYKTKIKNLQSQMTPGFIKKKQLFISFSLCATP